MVGTDEYPSLVSGVDVDVSWDADSLVASQSEMPAIDESHVRPSFYDRPTPVCAESWTRARGWLSEDE